MDRSDARAKDHRENPGTPIALIRRDDEVVDHKSRQKQNEVAEIDRIKRSDAERS